MSSESTTKSHTKVLEVFRQKATKARCNNRRQLLYFRVKPEKALNDVIISYNDLRSNFPYALIDYYQSYSEFKHYQDDSKSQNQAQNAKQADQHEESMKQPIFEQINQRKKYKKKQDSLENKSVECFQKIYNSDEKILQESTNKQEKQSLIFDYDSLLSQIDRPFKIFWALLSESETVENRYLKDLNNEEYVQSKKSPQDDSYYENKKKKTKTDNNQ